MYEVCIDCGNHQSQGKYCNGVGNRKINISGKGENTNTIIDVNQSYNKVTPVYNENVVVTFDLDYLKTSQNVEISKYVIVRNNDKNDEIVCDNMTKNTCSTTISSSGTYKVTSYDKNK